MTLARLLATHPERFYPQTWYLGEAFLDTEVPDVVPPLPHYVLMHAMHKPPPDLMLPFAAVLAGLYLAHPTNPMWRRYLWCADTDRQGQRVYVGANGKGFEIHRHLHLTERWGIPVWS